MQTQVNIKQDHRLLRNRLKMVANRRMRLYQVVVVVCIVCICFKRKEAWKYLFNRVTESGRYEPEGYRRYGSLRNPQGTPDRCATFFCFLNEKCDLDGKLYAVCKNYSDGYSGVLEFLTAVVEYVQWHREVEVRNRKLPTNRRYRDVPTLTYKCPDDDSNNCDGYGDRIEFISKGFLLAVYMKRFFTLQWPRSYTTDSRAVDVFQPNLINWNVDMWSLTLNGTCKRCLNTKSQPWKRKLTYSLFDTSSNTQNLHVFYGKLYIRGICISSPMLAQKVTNLICNETPDSKILHFLLFGMIARLLVKFTDAVLHKAEEWKYRLDLTTQPYVAVHIRTGLDEHNVDFNRYVSNGKFMISKSTWSVQMDLARKLAFKNGSQRPILLVTDSVMCKKWVMLHYPTKAVRMTNISFLHAAKDLGESNQAAYHDRVIESASELALLADAETIILSKNSGYSYLAALLSGLPPSKAITNAEINTP